MKCATKDRNLNPCRGNAAHGKFCKIHHYMAEYTDDMVAQAKPCGTCRKTYFMGDYTTCSACRERGGANREKSKGEHVKCAKDGCSFKQSENKYCGKHQLFLFLDEVKDAGMKACVNATRGCRSQMEESYKFTRCQECLRKDREKDHVKRGVVIPGKQCTVCCKDCPPEMFEGVRGTTLTCKTCRDANKRADEKRDAEHVNELARKNAQKPERKAVKKAWQEKNYESVAMYCLNHRQKQIENDLDGYHAHNAEVMQAWRDKNPDKVLAANQKRCENIEYAYANYKRTAELKQLDFELSEEEFNKLVKTECNYCGIMQEKGFNGIDRIDSTVGYIASNCVSCCTMCNFMKGCMDKYVFLNRIEHILTYNKFVEANLYPLQFREYYKSHIAKYQIYMNSAKIKNLKFELTEEVFHTITSKNCYICGKKNTEKHQNGLDRIDSNEGYIESNVHPCCGNCNYMKNNYTYKEFIDKCMLIYNHNKIENVVIENQVIEDEIVENEVVQEIRHIVKGNKLSSEERKEKNRLYKKRQRERLVAKYGDEEYKRMRAKEIAEHRRKNG